jgi:hypothetical protein
MLLILLNVTDLLTRELFFCLKLNIYPRCDIKSRKLSTWVDGGGVNDITKSVCEKLFDNKTLIKHIPLIVMQPAECSSGSEAKNCRNLIPERSALSFK